MDDSRIIPNNQLGYYLTCTGKIWWVSKEDILSGDAQQRRELIGNSFKTPEEAALAKVKLEAMNRLVPYTEKQFRVIDGCPAIVTKFHLDEREYNLLQGDIRLLAE